MLLFAPSRLFAAVAFGGARLGPIPRDLLQGLLSSPVPGGGGDAGCFRDMLTLISGTNIEHTFIPQV